MTFIVCLDTLCTHGLFVAPPEEVEGHTFEQKALEALGVSVPVSPGDTRVNVLFDLARAIMPEAWDSATDRQLNFVMETQLGDRWRE